MTKLQVLIATFGEEGLERLSATPPPASEGIEWIVCCQCPGVNSLHIPANLHRPDIHVYFSDSKGLSRNRNNLLDLASAPYCMIADDDLSFFPQAIHEVIDLLEARPEVGIAISRYVNSEGSFEKTYPETMVDLFPFPKGYFPTSFEIIFRLEPVIKSGVRFNERFGVGAPDYGAGEEDLWLHDLNKSGIKGVITPVVTSCHSGVTTGLRELTSPRVLRAQGAVMARLYPFTSILRAPLKAWRISRMGSSGLRHPLKWIMKGWLEGMTRKKKLFPPSQKSRG